EGDYFIVDLQTTSDNALLKLYDDSVLQKTLNILSGNADTSRQQVEVYVDSGVTFNQVRIISEMTDTEYLKLYNINATHWIFETEEDQRTMYIDPFGKEKMIANLGNNSLKIYEKDILQINIYITISYDLISYVYQSTIPETVFVSFYDSNNEYLDFNKFQIFIDYTIDGVLFEDQRLSSNQFFVDEGSYIEFDIYDSFNSSIYQASRLAKTFIDLTLNVYELKIKNEKLIPVEYTLKNNDTEITKSGNLFEDEILEYNIASGTYIFEYLEEGESVWANFTFLFTSNQIFVLNRSQICILIYADQQGNPLIFENYKTYLNGSRIYINNFYGDVGDIIGIEITDRYNISIANDTMTIVSGVNEKYILLTLYSLKVLNQQEVFNHINITRDPVHYTSDYYWSEWVAPNEIVEFKLFAGYYKINLTNNEDSSFSFYSYTLSGDDVLLISSANTLAQVIYNIANVNTTIGNQITNVEINITNQNSDINNTIINIDINLSNVNSTLGTLLTNIGIDITNVNTTIVNQLTALGVNITNINSSIYNQILTLSVDLTNVNTTIVNQLTALGVNITNINTTIVNQLTTIGVNITNMNSTIVSQILTVIADISNINTTIVSQITTLGVNITNINTTIVNQITALGVIITNINTSISNQIISLGVNVTNMNSTIVNQILTVIADISNINTTIVNQLIALGVNVTNINTSISNQIISLGVDISNVNTTIVNQILSVIADISNINASIINQTLVIISDISNINTTIVNQILSLGVNITNINASISNQIIGLEVDISNVNTTIVNQILLMIADISNVNASIINQTLVIISDISNVNTTIVNQMIALGVNITNVNATIYNQVLSLSVDLSNVNSSIYNLLLSVGINITNVENDIGTLYMFTNNSFINLNNVMNNSFIYMENNIIAINQTISNLVIGVSNDIYLINGTISTLITQLETNLLLMNVTINTTLFDLNTTINVIGSNITSNYILLNNSFLFTNTNINDSRLAVITNILLINNTISTLVSEVYTAVYLINNSIFTAVVDLGTYLSLVNNTISGNLSIVLKMNDFLTELYKMTMFSDMLNWTGVGLNTTLLTNQVDAWEFINKYKNESIQVMLRYNDLIENLTVSAQNTIEQFLPETGVEYRLWSEELQDYISDWEDLPENRSVDFGFFEVDVPYIPLPDMENWVIYWIIIIVFISIFGGISIIIYYKYKVKRLRERRRNPVNTVNQLVTTKKPFY
ncbi:hypothetical protein LCGC14_0597220, partial [marine sediment metagenome]